MGICFAAHLQNAQSQNLRVRRWTQCYAAIKEAQMRWQQVVSSNSKQVWNPCLTLPCAVHFHFYLFIFGQGQICVQKHWLSVTGRIKERHYKWSCQSVPTAGSHGKHPVLAHFIVIALIPHSKKKKKQVKRKERKLSSSLAKREKKDRTCCSIIAVRDRMNYECVREVMVQWLKSVGSLPSFLSLSLATN